MAFQHDRSDQLAAKFLFYKERREFEVQELLNEAKKSPEDYIKVIEKIERALQESRGDEFFVRTVQKVITGLRALVWPNKNENAPLLLTQVNPQELEATLAMLKNNSFRIEIPEAKKSA